MSGSVALAETKVVAAEAAPSGVWAESWIGLRARVRLSQVEKRAEKVQTASGSW